MVVEAPLDVTFTEISEEVDCGCILQLDIFKEIVEEVCGEQSQSLRDWKRQAPEKTRVTFIMVCILYIL